MTIIDAKYRGMTRERYNRFYIKGWAASTRGSDLDASEARFLDRNRREVSHGGPEHWAWEDGWFDVAAGREMWHLRDCDHHDNTEKGCGLA